MNRFCHLGQAVLVLALLLGAPAARAQDSLVDPGTYRGLAADHRAYRIGDVITVLVLEATRARSQAATDAASDLDIGVGLRSPSTIYDANLGISGSNSGGASTSRVGELRTQISARVVDLEPGGDLRIEGMQTLTVNGERQVIKVSGLIRPQDILAGNVVHSTRIANAELELAGVGVVSESQRQSIVYRLFKWLRLL